MDKLSLHKLKELCHPRTWLPIVTAYFREIQADLSKPGRIQEIIRERIDGELLRWCIPALLVGGLLRIWLMQGWQGAFYYGPDSQNYWETVFEVSQGKEFDVSSKRPSFYPFLMLLTQWGPKSPAYAAALIQHLIGWLTVIPFAAILRRLMVRWRWWVVPATVIYSIHPQLMYWEHVLIADSVFIALALLAVWAFLGFWCSPKRWELLAFALGIVLLSMATRPVGRALWLSMAPLMLILPGLPWRAKLLRFAVVLVLYPMASAATRVNQGDTLMFASTFPLMVLDKPPHEELKAEFAAAVREDRSNLWRYVTQTQGTRWRWMDSGKAAQIGPHYVALVADGDRRKEVTKELTRQAVLNSPFTYAWMIVMKGYHLCSLNTKAYRLIPDQHKSGAVKFFVNSLTKSDPGYQAFILGDARATNPEGIAAAMDDQLTDVAAQQRVLSLLPPLTELTTLYHLPVNATYLPVPQRCLPLVLFLIAIAASPWIPGGRNFLPLLVIGAGYMALTLVVGRAVERYRLPAEFLFFCGVFLGIDTIYALIRHLVTTLRMRLVPIVR